jgi:hypothetical protein
MLEAASAICDKWVYDQLNHTQITKNLDIPMFYYKHFLRFWFVTLWRNSQTKSNEFYSIINRDEGACYNFNPINASLIFRNDTVDPDFVNHYQRSSIDANPLHWSQENGYIPNKLVNYPLRVFDKGKDNGLTVYLKMDKYSLENVDVKCRQAPLSFRIILHHPADIPTRLVFTNSIVPINRSMTFFIKPRITKTSPNLKYFDPMM